VPAVDNFAAYGSVNIEQLTTRRANSPAAEAPKENLSRDVQLKNRIKGSRDGAQQISQLAGLRSISGIAIQDEPISSISASESLSNDAEYRSIVHEMARIHHRLHPPSQSRTPSPDVPEQITRGDVRDLECSSQQL
jgi:hypothetical protein